MTTARVLHPDLRVTLIKLVDRAMVNDTLPASQRYERTGRTIDLTPAFSELGSIHTTKNVRAPAGAFSLVFSDVPRGAAAELETLYGLIEPMDGIEIRLSHSHGTPGREPPVVMRGFVSRVSRSQGVDSRGVPTRTVTVEGQDYGKIWQMLMVLYRPLYAMGDTFLSNFRLFERFGIGLGTNITGNQLVAETIGKIINPHLARMLPADWPMPRDITPETIVPHGLTSVGGPQNAEGSLYSILSNFCDVQPGFNELYIEDLPDKVVAVYRPNPAIDLDGTPIQTAQGATGAPARTVIPGRDISSLALARSDADVANYFWVEDSRFELVRPFPLQQAAATSAQRATVYMEGYGNNDPRIYGLRPMLTATQMGESRTFNTGQAATGQAAREQEIVRWLDERRRILGRTNRDNVLLEAGTARIAGNENIRAGQHIDLGEGALGAPYYVAGVAHDYLPFRGFFTTLTLERGQGFARRIQADGSPWLTEMGGGAGVSGITSRRASVGQTAGETAPRDGAPPSTATEPA